MTDVLVEVNVCRRCGEEVVEGVGAAGSVWHTQCLQCAYCGQSLVEVAFVWHEEAPYCNTVCMNGGAAPRCFGCKQDIISTAFVMSLDRLWHTDCLSCAACSAPLSSKYVKARNKAYCSVKCVRRRRKRSSRGLAAKPLPVLTLPDPSSDSGRGASPRGSSGGSGSGSGTVEVGACREPPAPGTGTGGPPGHGGGDDGTGLGPGSGPGTSGGDRTVGSTLDSGTDTYDLPESVSWGGDAALSETVCTPMLALEAWLLAPPFGRAYRLAEVMSSVDRNVYMDALARTAVFRGVALSALKVFIEAEVNSTEEYTTLFRTDSPLTKFMKQYAELVGRDYLEASIGPMVVDLVFRGVTLEVDRDRLAAASPGATAEELDATVEANKAELTSLCSSFIAAILFSSKFVPLQFRFVCQCLQGAVATKFSDRPEFVVRALGGFLFLRFYCPAIVSPAAFGLLESNPPREVRRTLILVAKTLQNMANGVQLPDTSPMAVMNSFCREQQVVLSDFFEEFIKIDETTSHGAAPERPVGVDTHFKALMDIHGLAVANIASVRDAFSHNGWASLASLLVMIDPAVQLPPVDATAMASALTSLGYADGYDAEPTASSAGGDSTRFSSRLRSASRFMGTKLSSLRGKIRRNEDGRPLSTSASGTMGVSADYDVPERFRRLSVAFALALEDAQRKAGLSSSAPPSTGTAGTAGTTGTAVSGRQ